MCMWFWGYPAIIIFQLFAFFFPLSFFSCDIMMWLACGGNSAYNFIPNFLKLCRCFCHNLKMCTCLLGYPSIIFINFFFPLFRRFSGPISLRIDNLWVQLILQVSTYHFKLCIFVLHGLKMCGWSLGYLPLFLSIFSTFFT